ncbi:hypothetical protein [Methylorubrum extorquens]|uniref:hypothetical protein n=1 Tax=Methylorubrum extorquens TaxID=408 RepID=UPI00167FBB57|nr:hypothetical protein [Methylorubrum extorquens]WIU39819.1 hypothetical protein KQ926_25185 [Methylorubrum extorquens]
MSTDSLPRCNQLTSMTDSMRLRELADALGVPVAAFEVSKEFQPLNADADGNHWLLMLDIQGKPVIRRIGEDAGQNTMEERVSVFLRRDEESPARDALTALVDQLLVAHLTD